MERDQRIGFWAAIVSGLLALVGTLVMPVNIVSALLAFAFAWGIHRGQMWAALAAAAYAIIPMAVIAFADGPVVTRVFAITISLLFTWFFARAALALGRAGGGLAGRTMWIAIIVACGAFWIAFQPYAMPSASMENTILNNENVLVRNDWGRTPRNGDLIVFRYPPDPKQIFLKRVAGVPGDRIRFVNKQLMRNGAPVAEPYAVHRTAYTDPYRDNFPSEPIQALVPQGSAMLAHNVRNGEVVVPEGRYFVLGDNRDDSLDSRYWGFVASDQIIGKPFLVYASYELGSTPGTVTRTILNTRWNRLLKVL